MSWQVELNNSITTLDGLKKHIAVSPAEETVLREILHRHPMRVPHYYLSLIDHRDPKDPIRKMALPSLHETDATGSYDTSGEKQSTILPGLQHKYGQTALILSTNQCSMYCRHCFRKRLVGVENTELVKRFDAAAEYIHEHKEISNVLISGGDSLTLPTAVIEKFLQALDNIEHLDFIRFGSRMPVTLPSRIYDDQQLLDLFARYSKPERRIHLVTQFNHPRELTPEAIRSIDKLLGARVVVNNQAVLMRGVNDDPAILSELMSRLSAMGVNPYYLFQCRPVARVMSHFQLPFSKSVAIVEETRKLLNGPSKRFRFIMSHDSGKIEILGIDDGQIFFKYHQARDEERIGEIFSHKMIAGAGWLDDLLDGGLAEAS